MFLLHFVPNLLLTSQICVLFQNHLSSKSKENDEEWAEKIKVMQHFDNYFAADEVVWLYLPQQYLKIKQTILGEHLLLLLLMTTSTSTHFLISSTFFTLVFFLPKLIIWFDSKMKQFRASQSQSNGRKYITFVGDLDYDWVCVNNAIFYIKIYAFLYPKIL